MRSAARWLASPLLWVSLLFALLLFRMQALQPVFTWAFPQISPVIYDRASFFELFLSHLLLVASGSLGAAVQLASDLAAKRR